MKKYLTYGVGVGFGLIVLGVIALGGWAVVAGIIILAVCGVGAMMIAGSE